MADEARVEVFDKDRRRAHRRAVASPCFSDAIGFPPEAIAFDSPLIRRFEWRFARATLVDMSESKNGNGEIGSLRAYLEKRFEKIDHHFEKLDASVTTIKDRMATKGDIEDVRQEVGELEHRMSSVEKQLGKIAKSGRKPSNGH